jgi:hypothetical protein
MDRT